MITKKNIEMTFDDPEGFVDDIDDETLIGDLLKNVPKESDGVDNVIVVDGLPAVGQDKIAKLKDHIRKIFSKISQVLIEHYPTNDDGKTTGYCFLGLSSHNDALQAVDTMNNHRLDKLHRLVLSLFSDFEKYENMPDKWEPPTERPFKEEGNRLSHLQEPDACDQYAVLSNGGQELRVYLNPVRGIGDPKEVHMREGWTESSFKWSPLGSYLATCHSRGIAIWGCEDLHKIRRFTHDGVQFFDFSPSETYLMTYNHVDKSYASRNAEQTTIIIWETGTGEIKRSFKADQYDTMRWPIFKWSPKDEFFACMSMPTKEKDTGGLSVYDTSEFGMLDKKSIAIEGIKDFSWSPTDNILAFWVAEKNTVPARVVLLEMPTKNEIGTKALINVADCKMYWQKSGNFLCVQIERYSKLLNKQNSVGYGGIYYNFEIFHTKEKEIPVDSIEIKEEVHSFAWEPVGSKFAIAHGDSQAINISFYEVKVGQAPILKKKYERKSVNTLFWSPQGRHIALAGLRNTTGIIECIDTLDFTPMSSGEHFNCTDLEWDPTGRYFTTAVSQWATMVDNAYWLWSFQGRLLRRFPMKGFCQLLWRPRPPSLLSQKDIIQIRKTLKKDMNKYSSVFDLVDRQHGSKKLKEMIMRRRSLYDEFMKYRHLTISKLEEEKEQRLELRQGQDTSNLTSSSKDMEEEAFEILVSEESTIVD